MTLRQIFDDPYHVYGTEASKNQSVESQNWQKNHFLITLFITENQVIMGSTRRNGEYP